MSRPSRLGYHALVAILLLASGRAVAAELDGVRAAPNPGLLSLRTGDVDTSRLENWLGRRDFVPGYFVLTMQGPMDPARRAALAALGVTPAGFLPANSWVARLEGVDGTRLAALGFITWIGPFHTEWKIAPNIQSLRAFAFQTDDRRALAAQGRELLRAWFFKGAPQNAIDALRQIAGVEIVADEVVGGARALTLRASPGTEVALANQSDVSCVEGVPEYADRSNTLTRWIVQSNVPGVTPFYDRGIFGIGQVAGLIDSRMTPDHCSFQDTVNPIGPLHRKILAYNTTTGTSFHGTHVAGTLFGDAGVANDTRGIAYGAKVVFNTHPDGSEPSMYDHFMLHHSQGARVHSNSWGTDAFRDYDGGSRGVDAFTHDFEDDLVVFAVTDNSPLVTNPENAKNCLAVFATSESPNQSNWCIGGSGPTLDGRRKPEIGAPGCIVTSSAGSTGCGVATANPGGTSMACPAIAGAAILIREYYMSGFYPSGALSPADAFTPSGSLLKATILNSGVDIANWEGYPSPREGWGRILADNSVYFSGDASRTLLRDVRNDSPGALETGQESSLRVAVSSPAQPLRITLVWADAPADAFAFFTPVNDLDLIAVSPTGVMYRGNNIVSGASISGGLSDTLNNTEQVILPTPEVGVWQVFVEGTGVNQGPQGFALLLSGAVADAGCLADYNQDGNADQDDVAALIDDIASGQHSFPPNSPDINADGNEDQDDVAALIQLIASTGC